MDIIVEIGTNEQKKKIRKELLIVEKIVNTADPPINISRIIVTSSFEATVNRLEGRNDYRAVRLSGENEVKALARITQDDDQYAMVISDHNYIETQDSYTRLFTFIHEIAHLITKREFPTLPNEPFVNATYLHNLYSMYDEYFADRFAYNIMDEVIKDKSQIYLDNLEANASGLLAAISDESIYENIKTEISRFRIHADTAKFDKRVRELAHDTPKALVHAFSIHHHHPDLITFEGLDDSPFVNQRTFALMDFFKEQYKENFAALHDERGVRLVTEFFKNFGLYFEEKSTGPYLHVLDI